MWNYGLTLILLQVFLNSVATTPLCDHRIAGQNCMTKAGNVGICKTKSECPNRAVDGPGDEVSSETCGVAGSTDFVCCPSSTIVRVRKSVRPAEAACQQYSGTTSGSSDQTIDRRTRTLDSLTDFPYMAALGYRNQNDEPGEKPIIYSCRGILISPQYVLTAAHCLSNAFTRTPIQVRLGDTHRTEETSYGKTIPISTTIVHPDYMQRRNYNDVALVKLEREVQINRHIRPICLQTRPFSVSQLTPDTIISFVGLDNLAHESRMLKETPVVRIVDREECSASYTKLPQLPDSISEKMICAIQTNVSRPIDACHGVSGAPLLVKTDSDVPRALGTSSFGRICGGPNPEVYTSVPAYLDWIEENVWPQANDDDDSDRIVFKPH